MYNCLYNNSIMNKILCLFFFAGLIIISITYHLAFQAEFPWLLFWLGYLMSAFSTLALVLRRKVQLKFRALALFLYGYVFYCVQMLGSNGSLHFRDEYIFHSIAKLIAINESLDIDKYLEGSWKTLVSFPGHEMLVVYLHKILGVELSHAAMIINSLLHSGVLVVIFLIFNRFTNAQIAGTASFLYASNVDYPWFNTIYHYETLGLFLFFSAIYIFIKMLTQRGLNGACHSASFVCVVLALTISHHLSSYVLVGLLFLFVVLCILLKSADIDYLYLRSSMVLKLVSVVVLIWLVYSAVSVLDYFMYNIFKALVDMVNFSLFNSVTDNLVSTPQWGEGYPWFELVIDKYLYVPSLAIFFVLGCRSFCKNNKIQLYNNVSSVFYLFCFVCGCICFVALGLSATSFDKVSELSHRLLPFLFFYVALVGSYLIYTCLTSEDEILSFWKGKTLVCCLIFFIIFGGMSIGSHRVRGVDSSGPKYVFPDKKYNLDLVASGCWINDYGDNENVIGTDIMTTKISGINGVFPHNTKDIFLVPDLSKQQLNRLKNYDVIICNFNLIGRWDIPRSVKVFNGDGYRDKQSIITKKSLVKFLHVSFLNQCYNNGNINIFVKN